jgi:hypothetical protein
MMYLPIWEDLFHRSLWHIYSVFQHIEFYLYTCIKKYFYVLNIYTTWKLCLTNQFIQKTMSYQPVHSENYVLPTSSFRKLCLTNQFIQKIMYYQPVHSEKTMSYQPVHSEKTMSYQPVNSENYVLPTSSFNYVLPTSSFRKLCLTN